MTEEQRKKFGSRQYDQSVLEEHFAEVAGRGSRKEQGVTIKVKTLEEQKKEEEENERKNKEEEEKAKAKKEAMKTSENMEDMFDPNTAFYTPDSQVLFLRFCDCKN